LPRSAVFVLILALFLQACSGKPAEADKSVKKYTINPGDTLIESLRDSGLDPSQSIEIISAIKKVFDPRSCRPGDYFEFSADASGKWEYFRYYPSGLNYYSVEKLPAGATAALKKEREGNKVVDTASGKIKSSLWEAMVSRGLSPELINDFAEKFAWQIDFLTEPRVNDTYKLVWEKFVTDDGQVIKGKILAAQYIASGQLYTAVLYASPKGDENYYSPDGKSLRRAFLKAPLQYARISSYFTRKRFHPILRYFRPHLGIDYAAPSGTPVSSVADGTVIFAARKGGFGNLLRVRHTNGFVSDYGHLKGFKKGVRAGTRVSQGQVIGFVGSTGLSTGPHLDFRISKNGSYINFMAIKFPPAQSISEKEKENFKNYTKPYLTKLAGIRID